ncbi:hypothetical protein APHAL10511_003832 [Amanita phalloides]|nr:hypothetical protein APHAL10511_003832 [Amanita phalloides]
MQTTSTRSSSCLCGAVKFDVVGNPLSFMVCHCRNCQKSTGTAFASNTFFKAKNVHIKQGKDKIKDYEDRATASGNPLIRSFCEQCGSSIFLRTPGSDILGVPLGAVDDVHDWVPRREIFKDTKKPWVEELKTQGKAKL